MKYDQFTHLKEGDVIWKKLGLSILFTWFKMHILFYKFISWGGFFNFVWKIFFALAAHNNWRILSILETLDLQSRSMNHAELCENEFKKARILFKEKNARSYKVD